MNKQEFLMLLESKLRNAGFADPKGTVEYYEEMIDDRIEDGMSEFEAVQAMGDVDEIINNLKLEKPMSELIKDRVKESHDNAKKNGNNVLWIVLAIIGFPFWFPLFIGLGAAALGIFIALWAIVFAVFVVEISFGLASVACVFGCFWALFTGYPLAAVVLILGGAFLLGGLCILLWAPVKALGGVLIDFIKLIFRKIKGLFISKNAA